MTAVLSSWPSQPPTVFDATPKSLVDEAQHLIAQTKATWDAIAANIGVEEATFANVILPIVHHENARLFRARILRFYASTSPSKELRDASNTATKLFNDAEAELYCRPDIFLLVDAVTSQIIQHGTSLDDESKHYLCKLRRKMHMNGCGIKEPDVKSAFERENKRIKELVRQCLSNLDEDLSGLWLDATELAGVPDNVLATLKKGEVGSLYDGKLWVKTKVPHPFKIITSATSPATRKKVYYAMKNRLPQNIPLFRELVLTRDSMARKLGFSSFLAYKAADKMVQTSETVTSLLSEIRQRTRRAVMDDVSELLAIKREVEGPDAQHVFAWDEDFYSGIRTKRQQPERTNVSEYFELENTLATMLRLYGRLFGTYFEHISPDRQAEMGNPLIWHEDVRMFAMWDSDADGAFLGYAYFDLFPREGKYGHRGCYAINWGYSRPDGNVVHPSCALVMNYAKPADPKSPVLLSLVDVRRLFHELGHLHHTLCTKTKYASLSYVDRDFAEAPCLMLERFFWKESYIKDLSHHYSYLSPEFKTVWKSAQESAETEQPPLKLPDATVTKLADKDPKQFVNKQVYSLFLSSYDVLVHNPESHEALENMNLAVEYHRLESEITGFMGGEAAGDGPEWAHGESVFRMVVSGYEAGYYTYVLGTVYALDMFKASGFDTDIEGVDEEAGRRFRKYIFEPGGRQSEMETLTNYIGRTPRAAPYFQWLGV
ncbi:hypothetical protein QBC34DRAFT_338256 [Podospora aff. communis PSN243]|uniref:Peptidase M3A/M3B catalytic domain-containing protein n=1 Tax=Podospora aff. communis PSN243 TaxID=3040156 RepID=A0AAV9G126_9PEZI|nr:hypothetical protein QBC34DRAFT_338256 [Podospora aff. communis PSN243]